MRCVSPQRQLAELRESRQRQSLWEAPAVILGSDQIEGRVCWPFLTGLRLQQFSYSSAGIRATVTCTLQQDATLPRARVQGKCAQGSPPDLPAWSDQLMEMKLLK